MGECLNDMILRHQKKMYPPKVVMEIVTTNTSAILKIPVKFEGCSSDSKLDVDLIFHSGPTESLYTFLDIPQSVIFALYVYRYTVW